MYFFRLYTVLGLSRLARTYSVMNRSLNSSSVGIFAGFVVDYRAEALRDLRKCNFTEIIDHYFALGAHLNARDRKAVRRTVSGLMKILHPHLGLAIEGRRRVKEQLKKMGSFECYHTSFSYQDTESGEENFVGVPEQGGRDLIAADPLPPGTVYTASVSGDGTVGLYRLDVSISSGTGKLKPAGGVSGMLKEPVGRAFSYLKANKNAFGVARELDTSDFHVEAIDLLGNKVDAEVGIAFFVATFSSLRKASPLPGRRHEYSGEYQARAHAFGGGTLHVSGSPCGASRSKLRT